MITLLSQIEIIVEATVSWLEFLGYKGYDEADEEDIRIALGDENKALLARLDALPKSEYDKVISESLVALEKEWELV